MNAKVLSVLPMKRTMGPCYSRLVFLLKIVFGAWDSIREEVEMEAKKIL